MENTQEPEKGKHLLEKEQEWIKEDKKMEILEGNQRKENRRKGDRRKANLPVEFDRRMSNEDRRILERRKKQNEESRKRLRTQPIS